VERFEIPVTTNQTKTGVALDSETGLPLTFLFVDNTSNSLGTFESPYPTLAQAEAASGIGDAIYIFPGDGTDTGMDATLTLQDRQSLVGSGAPFEVATRFGTLEIPAQSANLPRLSNGGAGNAVVVANANTISGLNISTTGNANSAIFAASAANLTLQNAQIQTTGDFSAGVEITTFTGGDLLCNQVTTTTTGTYSSGILVDTFSGQDLTCNSYIFSSQIDDCHGISIATSFEGRDLTVNNSTLALDGLGSKGIEASSFTGRDLNVSQTTVSAPQGFGIDSASFDGRDLKIQTSTFDVLREGVNIGTYIGRDFTVDNSSFFSGPNDGNILILNFTGNQCLISNSELLNARNGIAIGILQVGDFYCLNSRIFSTGPVSAINLGNHQSGNIVIEQSTLDSLGQQAVDITHNSSTCNCIIQNNKMSALLESVFIQVGGGLFEASIQNNEFFTTGDDRFAVRITTSDPGAQVNLQYWKNAASSPNSADVILNGIAGLMQVQSPNLEQSGLEALNDGVFDLIGDITFIPFE